MNCAKEWRSGQKFYLPLDTQFISDRRKWNKIYVGRLCLFPIFDKSRILRYKLTNSIKYESINQRDYQITLLLDKGYIFTAVPLVFEVSVIR